jgi:hypothetical protein
MCRWSNCTGHEAGAGDPASKRLDHPLVVWQEGPARLAGLRSYGWPPAGANLAAIRYDC